MGNNPVGRPVLSEADKEKKVPKLIYRASSHTRELDDVLCFFSDVKECYGINWLTVLVAYLTRNINSVLQRTHDQWLMNSYKSLRTSREPALFASVTTAVIMQDHKEDFHKFFAYEVRVFDGKHNLNMYSLFTNAFFDVGFYMSPELQESIENNDYDALLGIINNCTDKDLLFWFISCCPIKDTSRSLAVSSLVRIKEVFPEDFYDYCLDYKDFYEQRMANVLLVKRNPDLGCNLRIVSKPAGIPPQVWEVIQTGLDEIYDGNCPYYPNNTMKRRIEKAYKEAYEKADKKNNRIKEVLDSDMDSVRLKMQSLVKRNAKDDSSNENETKTSDLFWDYYGEPDQKDISKK